LWFVQVVEGQTGDTSLQQVIVEDIADLMNLLQVTLLVND